MTMQVILLAIVLASTVVGTTTNPKRWAKVCLIALAISSALVSLLKAYSDSKDSQFIRGALAAEMASTKPTPNFQRAFVKGLNRVASTRGMRVNQAVIKDQGTLYFLVTQYTGIETGIVQFSADQEGQAYVNFVSDQSMDAVLSNAMFKIPDLTKDEAKASVVEELGLVGSVALGQNLDWVDARTQISQNFGYEPLRVQVKAASSDHVVSVELDPDFLNSILHDPPYARDWKAYQEFQRRMRSAVSH